MKQSRFCIALQVLLTVNFSSFGRMNENCDRNFCSKGFGHTSPASYNFFYALLKFETNINTNWITFCCFHYWARFQNVAIDKTNLHTNQSNQIKSHCALYVFNEVKWFICVDRIVAFFLQAGEFFFYLEQKTKQILLF